MFKYAAVHNRIDALAGYGMDIGPDTRTVTNPARTAARKTLATAQDELATVERALPQLVNGPRTPKQKNAALPGWVAVVGAFEGHLDLLALMTLGEPREVRVTYDFCQARPTIGYAGEEDECSVEKPV